MSWRKYLLVPGLLWRAARHRGDQAAAWERFWGAVGGTGPAGEVLWDGARDSELRGSVDRALAHMDATLPLLDLGCGNGRQARLLARHFSRVIGLDVSPSAIARARAGSASCATVSFRVLDITAPDVGRRLHEELGDANVFIRGVLHILDPRHQTAVVANARAMVGRRGLLYLLETNVQGDLLDYLEGLGARLGGIPLPLRRCIESGVAAPRHFGELELDKLARDHGWQVLASGAADIGVVPLGVRGEVERIPGYFAVLRPSGWQP